MDEFERDQLKAVLMQAIGEMGSEIERAIGEGLMAGLRAEGLPPPGIPAGASPYPRIGGVTISGPYTTTVLAPCGCSMPLQFKVHAEEGEQPSLAADVRGVLLGPHKEVGLAIEFTEVGSPIPCDDHLPAPRATPGSVWISRAGIAAVRSIARVANNYEGDPADATPLVLVQLSDLRALRAALPGEKG